MAKPKHKHIVSTPLPSERVDQSETGITAHPPSASSEPDGGNNDAPPKIPDDPDTSLENMKSVQQASDAPDDPLMGSIFSEADEAKVVEAEGAFFEDNGKSVLWNLRAIAMLIALTLLIAYDRITRRFHVYDSGEGLWLAQSTEDVSWMVGTSLRHLALRKKIPNAASGATSSRIKAILSFIKESTPLGLPPGYPAKLLPVANGVLDLSQRPAVLRSYRQEDFFTWKVPVAYEPDAKPVLLLGSLLRPGLALKEDEGLLQRYFGSLLQPGNHAQRILLLDGKGGSGKSVIVAVLEMILGHLRIAYLRASLLLSRFETFALVQAWLAVAKDVRQDYLSHKAAAMLKSLTGADWMQAEQKYGDKHAFQGNLNVIITSNGKVRIQIDKDASAWSRRILRVPLSREAPPVRIPNFAEVLVKEEGPGILNWLVEGFFAHQNELNEEGDFKLTAAQQKRNDDLIMESEAVLNFLHLEVEKKAGTLSCDEMWQRYISFAQERGWQLLPQQTFFTELALKMEEMFAVARCNDIKRKGVNLRGFHGVGWIRKSK